jgi:RNA polymerase sigma factor (sigma-70 family)
MIKTKISDSDLIRMYINGDENAFKHLVKISKSKVYTTIVMVVKDRYTAEDLLQETYIKILETLKSGKYNEEGKFMPWVCRVAHNLAIDYLRKSKKMQMVEIENSEGKNIFDTIKFSESSFEDKKTKSEMLSAIRTIVRELPNTQREVFFMRQMADMSFQEIAEATGVSINTALGRMRYALINIRKKLEEKNFAYDNNLYSG